jgi:hypothetical protein
LLNSDNRLLLHFFFIFMPAYFFFLWYIDENLKIIRFLKKKQVNKIISIHFALIAIAVMWIKVWAQFINVMR